MIPFFKSKPLLKDIIPNNYTDIHSHLLPGIDDGSKSIEESIQLIKQLKNIGFQHFITTPHIFNNVWNNTEQSIINKHKESIDELKLTLDFSSFNVAAEYMLDSNFLKKLNSEKLLTIKDNYILIEMSYLSPPIQLFDLIFEIQLAGYKPILAHPERYLFYYSKFNEFEKLKNAGCSFQLNLLSTVNYYGKAVTDLANKLLENNFIDFVGSDIHHQNHVNAFSNKIRIKKVDKLEMAISKNLFFIP